MKTDIQATWKAWKANPSDQDAHGELLGQLTPTIDSALKTYAGGSPSLKTRALILADEAVRSFDPEKGASLPTHVQNHLQRLYRVSAERKQAVHIPENVRLDSVSVNRFVADWKDKTGIEPSELQIADSLKMSRRRVQKAFTQGQETVQSKAEGEKGDSLVSGSERTPEQMWADCVYYDLDEKNRKIFEWTTGYLNRPVIPKMEIAKQLGISSAAVSQRINTIKKRLDKFYEADGSVLQ